MNIQEYLANCREDLALENLEEDTGDKNLGNYEQTLEELTEQLGEVENIKIDKLQLIQEKNYELQTLDQHIEHLQKENKIIEKKIVKNEFSLLEYDAIIIAYENNMHSKKQQLEEQEIKLKELKATVREMNEKIEKRLFEIMKVNKETKSLEM